MSKRKQDPTPAAPADPTPPAAAPATPPVPAAPAKPAGPTAEQRAAALAWAHAEMARLVPDTRPCGCGCGAAVKGRFLAGHDARLVSRLLKERLAEVAAAA